MKQIIRLLVTAAIITPAYAGTPFTFDGKPVHPACISQLIDISSNEKNAAIPLASCSTSTDPVKTEEGYLTTRDSKNNKQREFTRYTVMGNLDDKFLLDTTSWTGGSGFFTAVIWVEMKDGKLLLLNTLAGGDRCNGGTHKIAEWEYAINDTPYDLLSRASGKELPVKAYDDIESSAASCVAQTIFHFNPEKATASFVEMKLNNEKLSTDNYQGEIKYQVCFNEIYNQRVAAGKINLSQKDIDQFRDEFTKKCLLKHS